MNEGSVLGACGEEEVRSLYLGVKFVIFEVSFLSWITSFLC